MLGKITEKQPSKVAPLIVGNSGGFPLIPRGASSLTRRQEKYNNADKHEISMNDQSSMTFAPVVDKVQPLATASTIDESSEMNQNFVDGMSPEELNLALDEIRSLLSPKSIEFLQKGPVLTEVHQSTGRARESDMKKLPIAVSKVNPQQIENISLTPNSDNPWSDQLPNAERSQFVAESPSVDRYDLNGRKIVDQEVVVGKIQEEVTKSGLFNSSKGMAVEFGVVLAALCVECLWPVAKCSRGSDNSNSNSNSNSGYFVWKSDALESALQQPQDELKHHQFQTEAPGYSLREIMEMFRSEFANQRIIAMRMLAGILLRRECAVALEAYSEAFAPADKGEVPNELSSVEDEVGRESPVFAELCRCFEELVRRARGLVCTSASTGDMVVVDTATSDTVLSQEHGRQLRKLMCWSALHLLCAPDLPVELPTLLLWALSSNINSGAHPSPDSSSDLQLAPSFGLAAPRNNPAVAKLGLLRCLHMYLQSPAEEASIDWLRKKSTMWSSYGTPRLSTPHTRRASTSYEADSAECIERSSKYLNEDEEDQPDEESEQAKQRAPDSVAEAFALQCRWSRVSAIVSRGSVVGLLANHAISAVDALMDSSASKQSSSSSGDILAALGVSSLRLLAVIVRQGGEDILDVIHKQFLRPSWRVFTAMCDSEHRRGCSKAALTQVHGLWWHVLAELVLRDRRASAFLFDTHGEWTGPVVLQLLLRKNIVAADSRVALSTHGENAGSVAARVLKASLCFGFGFSVVTELLLADQVGGSNSQFSTSAAMLTLLEQAAVSVSAVLSAAENHSVDADASHVPFTAAAMLDEATEAGSSIFSFVRRNWASLQNAVFDPSGALEIKSAVLCLLNAVLNRSPEAARREGVDETISASPSRLKMAESIVKSCGLRGAGLVSSSVKFNAQLLSSEQLKEGGSVTAALLHLSGQGKDLTRFALSQDLFRLDIVERCIDACELSTSVLKFGTAEWLKAQELLLNLLRQVGCVAGLRVFAMASSTGYAADLSALVAAYGTSANKCCSLLCTPFVIASTTSGTASSDHNSHRLLVRGSVAEGILLWQYQRIQQAALLVQAQSLALLLLSVPGDFVGGAALGDSLDSLLAAHLPSLTANSHNSALTQLFKAYVLRLVSASSSATLMNSGENRERFDTLSSSIIAKVFGGDGKGSSKAFVIEGVVSGVSGIALCKEAGEWLKLPSSGAALVKANWAYEVLMGDLSGDQLADWLQVLVSQAQSFGAAQDNADPSLLAGKIYTLLKLSASDQAPKWAAELIVGREREAFEGETHQRAVDMYRELLLKLLRKTAAYGPSFVAVFCRVVSKEYFATTGMMSFHRNRARQAKRGASKYVNLEGMLDLCEKALDAGLNRAIDEQLHAVVLVALSSPIVPWSARQKVWSQVASLRLVHLLEDPDALLQLLPVLLPHFGGQMAARAVSDPRGAESTESLSLYLDVVSALSHLRSVEDRAWTIISVSVAQLTHFVFAETRVYLLHGNASCTNCISGQRAQLLLHLLELRTEGPEVDWIPRAVLGHAACVKVRTSSNFPQPELRNIVQEIVLLSSSSTAAVALVFEDIRVEISDNAETDLNALIV